MKNILLVEDDAEITMLLDLHLNNQLYSMTACPNGEEALNKISTNTFDLILLDIMLPGMNGMEVCKKNKGKRCSYPCNDADLPRRRNG